MYTGTARNVGVRAAVTIRDPPDPVSLHEADVPVEGVRPGECLMLTVRERQVADRAQKLGSSPQPASTSLDCVVCSVRKIKQKCISSHKGSSGRLGAWIPYAGASAAQGGGCKITFPSRNI